MPKACDLKKNDVVLLKDAPHILESMKITTPSARGASSIYRFRFRNLVNKNKMDMTCKGDDGFESSHVEKTEIQFMYSQGEEYSFMDLESYEQFTLQKSDIGDQTLYLSEDLEGIQALWCEEVVVAIELPQTVVLSIAECDPSIKGASATARTKPATCSTGLVVQVPEYICSEDLLKVDTRTGKYLARG